MKPFTVVLLWLTMAFAFGGGMNPRVALVQEGFGAPPAAKLRVLASDGVKEVIKELQPECERAIGHPLDLEFNTSAVLKQKIDAGEPFDATILTTGLIDDLIKNGKIAPATRTNTGRSSIGIGVRAGAPKPDISTPAALKRVLLNAKSITYNQSGASRAVMDRIYEALGITKEMAPKLMLLNVAGGPQQSVVEGKAELVVALVSEILPIKGLEILNAVPADMKPYIPFAGGVGVKSQNAEASMALLKFISGPASAPTFKAKGLELN